jgi:hypothetical protein
LPPRRAAVNMRIGNQPAVGRDGTKGAGCSSTHATRNVDVTEPWTESRPGRRRRHTDRSPYRKQSCSVSQPPRPIAANHADGGSARRPNSEWWTGRFLCSGQDWAQLRQQCHRPGPRVHCCLGTPVGYSGLPSPVRVKPVRLHRNPLCQPYRDPLPLPSRSDLVSVHGCDQGTLDSGTLKQRPPSAQ